MTTGERIKSLRQAKRMSQEELGVLVGVHKAAINKYETGIVVNLKRSVIEKLSRALDVSPSYLMGFEDHTSRPDCCTNVVHVATRTGISLEKELTDDQAAALIALIRQLPNVDAPPSTATKR